MKILLIFLMILCLGAFFIISNGNLHLSNEKELYTFGENYYSWIIHLGNNFKSITGYALKSDWLPVTNSTR